jgi:DNA polymerase-1
MATIDTNVPVDLDVESMRAGEPDADALRVLFTELEFTSLLKELLPVTEVSDTHYSGAKSAGDVERVVSAAGAHGLFSVAIEQQEFIALVEEEKEEEEPPEGQLSFMGGAMTAPPLPEPAARRLAISAVAGSATIVKLDSGDAAEKLRAILADGSVPKAVHDYKGAIHALAPLGITIEGVQHDPALYSYLLNPTYSSQSLAEVALRRFNLKLGGGVAESADLTGRLASALRTEVEQAGLTNLYEEMDLPLVGVLARMEQAGVKIDIGALSQMSSELEREITSKEREVHEAAGMAFNVGSPKQLGDVLFNRMNLPKPVKYGKGRTISTAVDVLEAWCLITGSSPN